GHAGGADLVGELGGRTGGDGEPEARVHRHDHGEVQARVDDVGRIAIHGGDAIELDQIVAHHEVEAAAEDGPRPLERTPGDHVDRAGERRAGGVGRGRVRHLDARDVVEVEEA